MVEDWGREFEAKFKLAKEISSSKNVIVIILPKRVVNAVRTIMKKVVFLHKSFDESMNSNFNKKIINDCRLYLLEEESLHRTIPFSDLRFLKDEFVDGAFSTTLADHDDLVARYGEKAIFTGHPRFNLYSSQYEVPEDILKIGRFCLFSSNFSMLFPTNPAQLNNIIRDNQISSKRELALREYIAEHIKRARSVLHMIRHFSNRRTIVYRPHPLEDVSYATSFFKGSSVIINKNYSIYPWLSSCDILLHSNCTSAVEAKLMGKKSVALKPLSLEFSDLPITVSDKLIKPEFLHVNALRNRIYISDLKKQLWGGDPLKSVELIASNIKVPKGNLFTHVHNMIFILFYLLKFHFSQLKTIKEQSRFTNSEINRILKTKLPEYSKIKFFRLFEAILVFPRK